MVCEFQGVRLTVLEEKQEGMARWKTDWEAARTHQETELCNAPI